MSQNVKKKMDSFPPSIFLRIKKYIYIYFLHKHIGEIHTTILGYDKGWVIKHIKAPARVKVELPNMCKNKMSDDV